MAGGFGFECLVLYHLIQGVGRNPSIFFLDGLSILIDDPVRISFLSRLFHGVFLGGVISVE
ncbi:hypothetical protein [Paludifilum halophilum]|uniref:hypothetical protein n=1 Tax=Paludifilum halophilum TaxID=1642702 RepID=UPI00113FF83B|nr:hypothetical protein [Paludifilum halophilum]